ncbi:MAG TPA: hypothetical protein PK916_12005 [Bacteroidota bacterium]|nr:hypothetical protein [Bacteroidota bacterium]
MFKSTPGHRVLFRLMLMALLCAMLPTSSALTQVLTVGSALQRDDIPGTLLRPEAKLAWPLADHLVSRTALRSVLGEQSDFQGLPRIVTSLHTLDQEVEFRSPADAIAIMLGGSLSATRRVLVGDARFALRYHGQWLSDFTGSGIDTRIEAEAGRARDVSVVTAVDRNVSSDYVRMEMGMSYAARLHAVLHATRHWMNDGNRKDAAYAYVLLDVLREPLLSLGYAWSWADSEWSTWRATGTRYDPRRRLYSWDFSYHPYFTPLKERGHTALLLLQWPLAEAVTLRGKASIPLWSAGRLKWLPASGALPWPYDFDATYEIRDILATQYEAGVFVQLDERFALDLGAEYFRKPYYRYGAGHLTVLVNLAPAE